MNEELRKDAEDCYRRAEEKAVDYFKSLSVQLENNTYVATLTRDIQLWKQDYLGHSLLQSFTRGKGKPDSHKYHQYIQWLDNAGKLDSYLDRSISYIFMRDLGKDLSSPDTLYRIQHVVDDLKIDLLHSTATDRGEMFSMHTLYRWAQKEGIESSMIWVLDKLKTVSSNLPEGMNREEAKRKLIKIIAGVVIHQIEEMGDHLSPEERVGKLDEAIRLGYSYGLTYPFIDDLLDSEVLTDAEKKQYSRLIRSTLITGSVPDLKSWDGTNRELIQYIHSELREAFTYIQSQLERKGKEDFFEQSFVFFHSQEVDREKDLSNANYTNEELYIPVILKSASSRLIARSVLTVKEDKEFDNRTFFYGIYNQLADDFADMFDDIEAGAVTPYTYYLKYHRVRQDLINPFELYWTVIFNLIHNVYHSDTKTRNVMLSRALNGQKRFKEKVGDKKYKELMGIFATGNPKFDGLIQKMVRKSNDVDFLDKLVRDQIIANFKNESKEREDFVNMAKTVRNQINTILHIPKNGIASSMDESIIDAANYSLLGDGKRLRPIMTWVMGVHEYGLDESTIEPLLKSLEYMHTASLIFDDLPAQDDSSFRRGRPTVHKAYNTAVAELTGLYLTQEAVVEQASLRFDPQVVLRLIRYSAGKTTEMCRGQAMDLNSKGKELTLDQLNTICFYKTGIAFEASLVMPAILAGRQEEEIEALKTFAYHAGIAFQIKDDLLDVEGDLELLGKPVGQDVENNNSNFVSILGSEGARKAMWNHYCHAMEALQELHYKTTYLKQILDYTINRDY
ncbi:polyprenyl synthetase family protein [Sporosarcina thermotolerans]|uniref:Polyprenyl synthetase family protein n=1 Tax=Sporosarcina thermotolerans TaxID=633404 RepID=A0AAW9A6G5_9BACL|nr:polyprenyl synthetase family protein [Sporosarcina thermotolerans]MDW0116525.1 polyprenyl synthetase family protein [Sporosarcina thermotolerans]